VRGLARECKRRGVVINERTAALELGPGRVRCAAGTVRADTILRTTETYTIHLPRERLRYVPLYSLMIATEPLPNNVGADRLARWAAYRGRLPALLLRPGDDRRSHRHRRGPPYRLREAISEGHERSEPVAERLHQTLRGCAAATQAAITHHWGPLAAPCDWSMSVRAMRR
jgi:hypothetical protein